MTASAMTGVPQTPVMEVRGLRKEFKGRSGRIVAIDNLDISIPGAGVYGFLGPNGSGKTTTIRCLLGLIQPTSGSVELLGTDTSKGLHHVIDRIGALVETPKFFPTFSGRKNLRMFGGVVGLGDEAVEKSLATVGLAERGEDTFSSYSLGMKQRLAVAATLLKDPQLIILDEPANGLDPAGIVEIRRLIRSLAAEGRTVFVSSHQLGEVQQTCDNVMIISKGRLIQSGPVSDLVMLGSQKLRLETEPGQTDEAVVLISNAGMAVHAEGGNRISVEAGADDASGLNRLLAESGIWLRSLHVDESSLESIFLELTGQEGEL